MKVEYTMGPFSDEVELPDDSTDEDIQADFEVWLWNRSDIGWSKRETTTDD